MILRLILGATLLAGGGMKISDPVGFFSDLSGYGVPFPEIFLRLVAAGLPWLEVFSGCGLILDFWSETIRPMVSVLWLIFVLMLGQALMRGLDLNCGCFGSGGHSWFERPGVAFARACILLVASLYVTAGSAPTQSTPHASD